MDCPAIPTKVPTQERELMFNCAPLGPEKICCCVGYFVKMSKKYVETVSLESRNILDNEGYKPVDVRYADDDYRNKKFIYYEKGRK